MTRLPRNDADELERLRKLARYIAAFLDDDWFIPCSMPKICGTYDERLKETLACIACCVKTELYEMTMGYAPRPPD